MRKGVSRTTVLIVGYWAILIAGVVIGFIIRITTYDKKLDRSAMDLNNPWTIVRAFEKANLLDGKVTSYFQNELVHESRGVWMNVGGYDVKVYLGIDDMVKVSVDSYITVRGEVTGGYNPETYDYYFEMGSATDPAKIKDVRK